MPGYLQQIHLEGKFPHVIMCNEALSLKCESRTWGAGVGNSDPGSRHRCAQPWGAVSAGVAGMLMFSRKRAGRQESWKQSFVLREERNRKTSWLLQVSLWQTCRSGLAVCKCGANGIAGLSGASWRYQRRNVNHGQSLWSLCILVFLTYSHLQIDEVKS